MKLLNFYLRV